MSGSTFSLLHLDLLLFFVDFAVAESNKGNVDVVCTDFDWVRRVVAEVVAVQAVAESNKGNVGVVCTDFDWVRRVVAEVFAVQA